MVRMLELEKGAKNNNKSIALNKANIAALSIGKSPKGAIPDGSGILTLISDMKDETLSVPLQTRSKHKAIKFQIMKQ